MLETRTKILLSFLAFNTYRCYLAVWAGYTGITTTTTTAIITYVTTRALYISGAGPRVRERERERDGERVPTSEVGGVSPPKGAFKRPRTNTPSSSPITTLILSRRERAKARF